jgi:hypothetical protein
MSCAHSVLCFRKLSKLSFSLVPNSEFQTRSAFGKEKNESIRTGRNGDFPNCLFKTSFIFQTRSSKLGVPLEKKRMNQSVGMGTFQIVFSKRHLFSKLGVPNSEFQTRSAFGIEKNQSVGMGMCITLLKAVTFS